MAAIAALAISAGVSAYGAYSSSQASKKAAQLQSDATNKAMGLQTDQYGQARSDLTPYRTAGTNAVANLQGQAANFQPWTEQLSLPSYDYAAFKAPTAVEAAAEPGVRLMQQEAQDAIQKSAAARGTLLSGNTLTALQDRSAGIASQAYGDVYARAQNAYATNANEAYKQYQARYNQAAGQYGAAQQAWAENQDRPWQQQMQLANLGYGASTAGAGLGQNYANQMGSLYGQQGNALAAGTIGSSNAINAGLYGATDDLTQAYLTYLAKRKRQPQGGLYDSTMGMQPYGQWNSGITF